jgi:hypothetical protein
MHYLSENRPGYILAPTRILLVANDLNLRGTGLFAWVLTRTDLDWAARSIHM